MGVRGRRARADARHDRVGHDLPAPLPGAPRARAAPDRVAFLPLLALAHHRHGDQGMGGDPSQAPRQVRDRRTIRTARRSTASTGCSGSACSCTSRSRYNKETMERYGHGTPDDWIERNVYTRHSDAAGCWLMGAINIALFGLVPGHADPADADRLDSVLGRRRDQRHRPLLRLPQLRRAGRRAPTSCRGAS